MRKAPLLMLLVASRLVGLDFDTSEFEVLSHLQGLNWGYSDFTAGIDHFGIDAEGLLYTWDKYNGLFKVLTIEESSAVEAIPLTAEFANDTGYRVALAGQYVVIRNSYAPFIVLDLPTGQGVEISLPAQGLSSQPADYSWVMIDDLLFYEPRNVAEYHTFQIIETDDGLEAVYRDPDETRAFIEETYSGTEGFHYDNEGYLFYGNRLVTANGDTFIAYFGQERLGSDEVPNLRRSDATLVGVDEMGNYYWQIGRLILIYDADGRGVKAIGFDAVPEMGRLQIDPHGNIYVLSYGGLTPGQLDLLWIENTWSTPTAGAAESPEGTAQVAQAGPS